jgi:predicted transposase/invertase (TIGR01784 family)
VYVVSVLNFCLSEEEGEKRVIERVSLMNEQTKEKFSDKLKFVYIQLPRFTKRIDELETNVDSWLYLLRNLEKFESRPAEVQGYIFERLFHLPLYNRLNSNEMDAYKKSVKNYDDIREAILFAEEYSFSRGEKLGINIGEKRKDKQNRTEFAIKCYRKGMSIAEIADLTDLSAETVREIIDKLSLAINQEKDKEK